MTRRNCRYNARRLAGRRFPLSVHKNRGGAETPHCPLRRCGRLLQNMAAPVGRRHIQGRWASRFNNNEQGVSIERRRLEQTERDASVFTNSERVWANKKRMIDAYNARALVLMRGSGFVEAFHLLSAALEVTNFD